MYRQFAAAFLLGLISTEAGHSAEASQNRFGSGLSQGQTFGIVAGTMAVGLAVLSTGSESAVAGGVVEQGEIPDEGSNVPDQGSETPSGSDLTELTPEDPLEGLPSEIDPPTSTTGTGQIPGFSTTTSTTGSASSTH